MVFDVGGVVAALFQHITGRWADQDDIGHFDVSAMALQHSKFFFRVVGIIKKSPMKQK
jgi:hypothetical protein